MTVCVRADRSDNPTLEPEARCGRSCGRGSWEEETENMCQRREFYDSAALLTFARPQNSTKARIGER